VPVCDLVAQIPNTMEVSFVFFHILLFSSSCLFYILHRVSSLDMDIAAGLSLERLCVAPLGVVSFRPAPPATAVSTRELKGSSTLSG